MYPFWFFKCWNLALFRIKATFRTDTNPVVDIGDRKVKTCCLDPLVYSTLNGLF